MKTNTMRTPLIISAAVLLVFALLVYFTSATPGVGVFGSVGLIIIGIFRFIQWTVAMIIGLTFSIAVLFGVFLLCVAIASRQKAAEMYQNIKRSVVELLEPAFCYLATLRGKKAPDAVTEPSRIPAPAAGHEDTAEIPPAAAPDDERVDEPVVAAVISAADLAEEIKTIAEVQQKLTEQITTLNAQVTAMEEKSTSFATAGQVDSIAGEITASNKSLGAVQESMTTMEGKISETVHKVQTLSAEKLLGDLPARLKKIEQDQGPAFDPTPLNEALAALQTKINAIEDKITETTQQVQALSKETLLGDLPARLETLEQATPSFDPQPLNESMTHLNDKVAGLEEKSSAFVAAEQLDALSGELTASAQSLASVQESVTALEGTITEPLPPCATKWKN
jgi:predicted  nucleic acid-binding Zn-ribbon protein